MQNAKKRKKPTKAITSQCLHVNELTSFPPEIITHILQYLDRKSQFTVSEVSELFNDIIYYNVGFVCIKLKDRFDCHGLKGHPLLKNTTIDCGSLLLSNTDVACLAGIRTLNLGRSVITADSVLDNLPRAISILDLINGYKHLADAALEALKGVHTITIRHSNNFTSEGIKTLKGVHSITLECLKLEWLQYLEDSNTVGICDHDMVLTDDGLKLLARVKHLALDSCCMITESGFKQLSNLTALRLYYCDITDDHLKHMVNVEYFLVHECPDLTDACLKHLTSLKTLDITGTWSDITTESMEGVKVNRNISEW